MKYEREARERQGMLDEIDSLKAMLHAMESDFAECAKTGKSQCFFCAHDETCDGRNCNFKWQSHN